MTKWIDGTRKNLPKYVEKETILEMLKKARCDNQRNYLMLRILWESGIRVSELVNLKKGDVREDELTIRQGKGSKDRIVPINTALVDLLAYYSAQLTLTDTLFPISEVAVRNICKKYQGEQNIHPHTFRHSYAVYCLKQGMNIRVLQKILGHESLATTSVYLDLVGADIKNEYKKIDFNSK
jgi:integrase/recombinase XerD